MKIIGGTITGERSRRANIPGRRTLRARPGAQFNISLQSAGFPVAEAALASAQRAFSGVSDASVSLGIGEKAVE